MGPELQLAELSTGHVEGLVGALEARGLAPATLNRYLAVLSAILDDARADGVSVGECRLLYRGEPEGRLRWFSEEEVTALVASMGLIRPEWAPLIRVLADTGLRPSEALRLEWRDIDLGARRLRVWRSKTGRARMVPVSRAAAAAFESLIQDGGKPRGPWYGDSLRTIQHAFARAKWRVPSCNGDDSATLYCLRHTCASRLVESGVHLRTVGEWLGHSSIRTTQRYAHVASDLLESARDALDARSMTQKEQNHG